MARHGFVLHLLRPADPFADIGANMGTYTVPASGSVSCRSESFKPVAASYQKLQSHVALKPASYTSAPVGAR